MNIKLEQRHSFCLIINRFLFYFAAAVFSFVYAESRFLFLEQNTAATLAKLVEGGAATPFQYRLLIPQIVNFLSMLMNYLNINFSHIQIFKTIEFLAAFSIVCILQYFLSLILPLKEKSHLYSLALFPLLSINYILPRGYPYFYPSDTPSVLFVIAGLVFLYKRNLIPYYCLFVVGVFNRETICFLTFVYFFTAIGRESVVTIVKHCVLQLAIWLIIKVYLYQLFMGNPGAGVLEQYHSGTHVSHLSSNLDAITNPVTLLLILSSFGFIWVFVLIKYSRIDDFFVRHSLKVVFPYFFGMMFVANIDEIRVFGELFPYLASAFALVWSSKSTTESLLKS